MDDNEHDQTKRGCIPTLWNELGTPSQGCLLLMIPLIIGSLRLIVKVWDIAGSLERAMLAWVAGWFVGGTLNEAFLDELRQVLGRMGSRRAELAIGFVVAGAAVLVCIAPTIGHRAGIAALVLGVVFGLLSRRFFRV